MRDQWTAWTLIGILLTCSMLGCGSGEPTTEQTSGGPSATGDDTGIGGSASPGGAAARGPAARGPTIELHPEVAIETSHGLITLRLDAENAPLTVDNFLNYVKHGHYDGTIFHQVSGGYVVLGGGYTPDLNEKPTSVEVRNEAHNGLSNRRGTIAMARSADAIDSSTCQFFINLSDNAFLDHQDRTVEKYGYCVFGEVIEGLDVADRISKVPTQTSADFESLPVETVMIKSARRLR